MNLAPAPELHISSNVRGTDPVRVELAGELVIQTAGHAREILTMVMATHPRAVDIDLTDVHRLDAAGLAAVTSVAMAARRTDVDVAVIEPDSPSARQVADRVGVLALIGRA